MTLREIQLLSPHECHPELLLDVGVLIEQIVQLIELSLLLEFLLEALLQQLESVALGLQTLDELVRLAEVVN